MLFAIADCRLTEAASADLCDRAHELRKISAVVRGMIERVKARVHGGFGQRHAV
jgi:hypothetical protein